jgi:hypothetical protein
LFIVAFNGLWPLEHGPRLDEQAGMALGCSDGLSLNVPGEGGPNGVGRKRHSDWLSGIWVGGRGKGRGKGTREEVPLGTKFLLLQGIGYIFAGLSTRPAEETRPVM